MHNHIKKIALISTLILNSFVITHAKEVKKVELLRADTNNLKSKAIYQSLDSLFDNQHRRGFNGAVLVGYKGKIIFENYYGTANKTTGAKWNENTASQLASTSKPFTGTAIMWLQQNKFLNINDPVNKYLPNFPYENITIKHLLTHRSGLQDYTKMGLNYWKRNDLIMYNEDLLLMFAKHKPSLRFSPDSRFEYCNTNYGLLARIVEEVSKMPFSKFMKNFIFEPLGMHNTFVYDPMEKMPANRSQGYKSNWSIHEDMFADGVNGDKGIFSTVQDMYKWDQSFYKGTLLNKISENASYTPSNPAQINKNYGLGWRMLINNNQKIIFHNGNWHSNNVLFYRFVEDNFTIIVLGNKWFPIIYSFAKPVYDIVRKFEPIKTPLGKVDDM